MDLWSHPTSIKLRECADASLAAANAALAARRAKLQEGGKGGATTSLQQPATPTNRRRASGSQRSGSKVVRSGKKGDKVRVEPAEDESPAAPAPQAPSALKGMNVRALRQRARSLGIDEEELTAAVEGNDPKRVLIGLIQAKELSATQPVLAEPAQQTGGTEPAASSALKGMSVRSLRQRARGLGVEEADLIAAIEGDSPKTELIKLILAKEGPSTRVAATADPAASLHTTGLDTLPAMLRTALEEVEGVDTSGGDSGADSGAAGGAIIGKQLNRMKQTYVADLSAVLSQVEAALVDPPSATAVLLYNQSGGSALDCKVTEAEGRAVSLLEGMEREILHNLLLGPLLPAESLAAISQTCRGLLSVVRSAEMQQYWTKHWVSRWGSNSSHKSTEGRDLPITAEAFFQRANLELAWRTTRWNTIADMQASSVAAAGGGKGATGAPSELIVEGDTDGTVRVWDVAHCVHAASVGAPMGRECRLGLHRLHHKEHPVRWTAVHGRRLLAGCADGIRDDTHSPGRLVLVDLDDSSTNPGQRCLGVAASSVDAFCGFIGTGPLGDGETGNGIPEQMGWAGIERSLVGFNLELEYGTAKQQRPLSPMVAITIATRAGEYVYDVGPTLGVGDSPPLSAAVATNHGDVCLVDLGCWHQGIDQTEGTVFRRWSRKDLFLDDGISSLVAVPSANAIVASWVGVAQGHISRTEHILRMLDPRQEEPVAAIGHSSLMNDTSSAERGVILSVFSPPSCGVPIVLATLDTGNVVSIDLRMLGKGSPSTWPVVIAPEAAGGIGMGHFTADDRCDDNGCAAWTLSGDGKTLLAARRKGVLVGVYGRPADVAGATDAASAGDGETRAEKWERVKQERKDKKQRDKERKAAKAMKKQTKDAGRRQTTGRQGGRSKGSR